MNCVPTNLELIQNIKKAVDQILQIKHNICIEYEPTKFIRNKEKKKENKPLQVVTKLYILILFYMLSNKSSTFSSSFIASVIFGFIAVESLR